MKKSTIAKRRALVDAGKARFLYVAEYAERIGFSERTVRDWMYRGIVPYMKFRGHRVLIDPLKADAALARFEQKEIKL
jgi:hypothetical protein